jgi:hypothetical protein
MKSVRITWMGKPLHKTYPHATKWQVIKWKTARFVRWFIRMFAFGAIFVGLLTAAFFYGEFANRTTVSYVAAATVPSTDLVAIINTQQTDKSSCT